MKPEKMMREDRRGEVFSRQVIVGYPRKTALSDRERPIDIYSDRRKRGIKKSQNRID